MAVTAENKYSKTDMHTNTNKSNNTYHNKCINFTYIHIYIYIYISIYRYTYIYIYSDPVYVYHITSYMIYVYIYDIIYWMC